MEIVALNITNLTDARYFAARNASWIIYNLSTIDDVPKVKQLQAWIDANKQGAQVPNHFTTSEINHCKESLNLEAIVQKDSNNGLILQTDSQTIKVNISEQLKHLPSEYLLKEKWTPAEIKKLPEFQIKGIVVQGTQEEEIGIKNYEYIDDLLDMIDEINFSLQ